MDRGSETRWKFIELEAASRRRLIAALDAAYEGIGAAMPEIKWLEDGDLAASGCRILADVRRMRARADLLEIRAAMSGDAAQ